MMVRLVISFVSGSMFAFGLLLSGMTDTSRVQGFLDITGAWDPTLAFVMGGAIIPMAIAWRVLARRKTALTGSDIPGPASAHIDRGLITGAVMFGAGWGLVGFCPGPALAAFAIGEFAPIVFVLAMFAGMWIAARKLTQKLLVS